MASCTPARTQPPQLCTFGAYKGASLPCCTTHLIYMLFDISIVYEAPVSAKTLLCQHSLCRFSLSGQIAKPFEATLRPTITKAGKYYISGIYISGNSNLQRFATDCIISVYGDCLSCLFFLSREVVPDVAKLEAKLRQDFTRPRK